MKALRRYLSGRLSLLVVVGLERLYKRMPLSSGKQWGGSIGRLCFLFFKRSRQKTLLHLQMAYPEATPSALQKIAKSCFEHLGISLMELFQFRRRVADPIPRNLAWITIEGEAFLQSALSAGKGVILVTGHIGNWEIMGAELVRLGYPLHVLARPLRNPHMQRWISRQRASYGLETIDQGGPGAARQIRSVLKSGRILACLIDQDINKARGVFVKFFNRSAYTPFGAVKLALCRGLPMVPAFIVRLPSGQHHIRINPPLWPSRSSSLKGDIATYTASLTSQMEAVIREAPEQWVWMHRRWKTQTEKPSPLSDVEDNRGFLPVRMAEGAS